MSSLWHNYWKILKLDNEPFETVKQTKYAFGFALKLFIVVGLIAGLGKLAGISDTLEQPTLSEQSYQLAVNIESFAAESLPRFLQAPAMMVTDAIKEFSEKTAALQAPVGARPGRAIRQIGNWLETPFELLTRWMALMMAIWIVARLMGGKGSLPLHLSLLSLAVAPQVLTIANYVPGDPSLGILGRILSLTALIWSLIILVPAIAFAHDVDSRQAFKILVVFVVVAFIVLPIVLLLAGGYILSGAV